MGIGFGLWGVGSELMVWAFGVYSAESILTMPVVTTLFRNFFDYIFTIFYGCRTAFCGVGPVLTLITPFLTRSIWLVRFWTVQQPWQTAIHCLVCCCAHPAVHCVCCARVACALCMCCVCTVYCVLYVLVYVLVYVHSVVLTPLE